MKKLITIMSLAIVGFTFGQEDEPKFNVSGSVDAYWRANLSAPNDEANTGTVPYAAPSVFANQSGFSVGMANVTFSYEGEDVGFVADFAYGPRANAGVDLNSPDAGGVINRRAGSQKPIGVGCQLRERREYLRAGLARKDTRAQPLR